MNICIYLNLRNLCFTRILVLLKCLNGCVIWMNLYEWKYCKSYNNRLKNIYRQEIFKNKLYFGDRELNLAFFSLLGLPVPKLWKKFFPAFKITFELKFSIVWLVDLFVVFFPFSNQWNGNYEIYIWWSWKTDTASFHWGKNILINGAITLSLSDISHLVKTFHAVLLELLWLSICYWHLQAF